MNYKAKQQEFKKRLRNSAKFIWVSKAYETIRNPLTGDKMDVFRIKQGTYIKAKHGLIGSKAY